MPVEKSKVYGLLKPKASKFGFTREQLEDVSETIGNGLADDATDADITSAIDGVVPFLSFGQRAVGSAVEAERKKHEAAAGGKGGIGASGEGATGNPDKKDDEPTWFKTYREGQEKRLEAIEKGASVKSRQERLEKILDGVKDDFKTKELKSFSRMNFEKEEDFKEYLEEVKQDAANSRLGGSTVPGGGKGPEKEATKEEVESVISNMGI